MHWGTVTLQQRTPGGGDIYTLRNSGIITTGSGGSDIYSFCEN